MEKKSLFIDADIKVIGSKTRAVKLIYIVSCGCGVDDVEIERIVDEDSPLRDGDTIYDLFPTDKRL